MAKLPPLIEDSLKRKGQDPVEFEKFLAVLRDIPSALSAHFSLGNDRFTTDDASNRTCQNCRAITLLPKGMQDWECQYCGYSNDTSP